MRFILNAMVIPEIARFDARKGDTTLDIVTDKGTEAVLL